MKKSAAGQKRQQVCNSISQHEGRVQVPAEALLQLQLLRQCGWLCEPRLVPAHLTPDHTLQN
jgi:hypothetical protein